mmetsp:Transcript_11277/g.31877  ORF Transcript_11277/g.31877 Transcript_11277/m.31877 type:complete len:320 (-) Transcript_11277:143-1102(-)
MKTTAVGHGNAIISPGFSARYVRECRASALLNTGNIPVAAHGVDHCNNSASLRNDLAVVIVQRQVLQRLATALLQVSAAGVRAHAINDGGDAAHPSDGAGILVVPRLDPQLLASQLLHTDRAGEAPHGRQYVAQIGILRLEAGDGILNGHLIGGQLGGAGGRRHGRAGCDAGRLDGIGQVRQPMPSSVSGRMMPRRHIPQTSQAGDAAGRAAVVVHGVVLLLLLLLQGRLGRRVGRPTAGGSTGGAVLAKEGVVGVGSRHGDSGSSVRFGSVRFRSGTAAVRPKCERWFCCLSEREMGLFGLVQVTENKMKLVIPWHNK